MTTAKFQAEKIDQMLAQQDVFGELLLPDERQYLLDHSQVKNASVGEVLCFQHEEDNKVFILLLGEVEVIESASGGPIVLARLKRGEIFGEVAALFHLPRISTVTVSKPSVVLVIPGDVFEGVITKRPELRDAVWQRYHQRLCTTVLRMVKQFRQLPELALEPLLDKVSLASFERSSVIVESGSPGDALFIIISGEAEVSQRANGQDVRVAILKPGDYFGEWSMLTGAPCSATVTARSAITLLCIDRADFLRFIQDHPSARDGIDLVAHNRQTQTTFEISFPPDNGVSANTTSRYFSSLL